MANTANKWHYKHILLNVTILMITSIISMVFVEIALRLYGITPSTDRMYAYEFDDTLGWKTKTSFKYFRSTPYYSHFNYYNPDGFPTTKDDWQRNADPQTPSVAFIGDSFTEGYYLPYELTFPFLVGKQLDEQVINLGVSGYAPDQYLLTARKHLKSYKINTIVVMFFPYNDIHDTFKDTYQGYAKPIFGETLDAPINLPLPQLQGRPEQESWLQACLHSSAIYSAVRPIIRKYFALPVSADSEDPIRYEKAQMKKSLALIKQIQREFPVQRFLVYYIPAYAEIAEQTLTGNIGIFRELCQELDMECASLSDILPETPKPEQYYLAEDGHFSREGADAVAKQVSDLF